MTIMENYLAVGTPSGTMQVFTACPEGGTRPVMIVIQEVFGVNQHIKNVCRRFAEEGYIAMAAGWGSDSTSAARSSRPTKGTLEFRASLLRDPHLSLKFLRAPKLINPFTYLAEVFRLKFSTNLNRSCYHEFIRGSSDAS